MKKERFLQRFLLCLCLVVLVLVAFPFLWSFGGQAADQEKTLKIGVVVPLTGMFAAGLRDIVDAIKPTADLMNKKGSVSVNGQRYLIELVIVDDQSSPAGAVAAVNKLIQDRIKFMIPPYFIPNVLAVSSLANEAKIVSTKPMASGQEAVNPNTPYSFASSALVYNTPVSYDYLKRHYPNAKRIAIVSPDDPGVNNWCKQARSEMQKNGLELVFDDRFKVATEDFYPILTKALEKKPDAIDMIGVIEPWSAGIINQSRELGFKGPIFTSTGILGDVNIVKGMVNPQYLNDIFHAEMDVLSPKMTPIVKDFRTIVERNAKKPLTTAHVTVLDAVYVLVQGIEKAQSLDADDVRRALEGMKNIDTVNGKGRMAGEDLFGINHVVRRPIAISGISNGKVWCEFTNRD